MFWLSNVPLIQNWHFHVFFCFSGVIIRYILFALSAQNGFFHNNLWIGENLHFYRIFAIVAKAKLPSSNHKSQSFLFFWTTRHWSVWRMVINGCVFVFEYCWCFKCMQMSALTLKRSLFMKSVWMFRTNVIFSYRKSLGCFVRVLEVFNKICE